MIGNAYDVVMPWVIFFLVVVLLVSVVFDIGEFIFHKRHTNADDATEWTERKKQQGPTSEDWAAIVERRRRG